MKVFFFVEKGFFVSDNNMGCNHSWAVLELGLIDGCSALMIYPDSFGRLGGSFFFVST